MWIYLFSFGFSLFLANIARNKSKYIAFFIIVISLLPEIIIAGFRDITIGNDLTWYVYDVFQGCMSDNDKIIYDINSNMEKGYIQFNKLILLFTTNFNVFLFFLQCLIMLPFGLVLLKMRNNEGFLLVFFIYLFSYFNNSLNIVRQSVALSFVLLAVLYLLKGKRLLYLFLCLVALSFHTSSILSFLFYPLFIFSGAIKKKWITSGFFFFLILIFFSSFIKYQTDLLTFVLQSGVIDFHYLAYLDDGNAKLSKSDFIVRILTIFFVYFSIYKNKEKRYEKYLIFFFVVSLTDFFLLSMGLISVFLSRLSLYANIISCMSIPYCNNICMGRYHRVCSLAILLLYFFNWLYIYIINNGAETYPYTSKILGI